MKYIISSPIPFTDPDLGRSSSGHKFHNWITGLYLSKLFNLEYIYTPFTQDAERYENFLNLHTGYRHLSDIGPVKAYTTTHDFCHDDAMYEGFYVKSLKRFEQFIASIPEGSLINLGHNPFPGMLTQHYEQVIPELQKAYWKLDRNINLIYLKDKVSVAIHIRRGDINFNNNPDRWLDLTHYRNIIGNLNRELGENNLDICIFSEGQPEDFKDLATSNVRIILGGSDLVAIHHMCSADILVTGQSSFSIMAAYFNKNFVIYTPLKNFMYKWGNERIMPYTEISYHTLKTKLLNNE